MYANSVPRQDNSVIFEMFEQLNTMMMLDFKEPSSHMQDTIKVNESENELPHSNTFEPQNQFDLDYHKLRNGWNFEANDILQKIFRVIEF